MTSLCVGHQKRSEKFVLIILFESFWILTAEHTSFGTALECDGDVHIPVIEFEIYL